MTNLSAIGQQLSALNKAGKFFSSVYGNIYTVAGSAEHEDKAKEAMLELIKIHVTLTKHAEPFIVDGFLYTPVLIGENKDRFAIKCSIYISDIEDIDALVEQQLALANAKAKSNAAYKSEKASF